VSVQPGEEQTPGRPYCSLPVFLKRAYRKTVEGLLTTCPGFGQDTVNFHWNPGRDTAWRADPTWPNRAGYSIPCAVTMGSGEGELGSGNSVRARERTAVAVGESSSVLQFVLCILLICIIVIPVPFVCCSVKLPLSRPTGFCLFHSSPHPSGGRGGLVEDLASHDRVVGTT